MFLFAVKGGMRSNRRGSCSFCLDFGIIDYAGEHKKCLFVLLYMVKRKISFLQMCSLWFVCGIGDLTNSDAGFDESLLNLMRNTADVEVLNIAIADRELTI